MISDPEQPVRLTKLAQRAGCAAKQPPGFLFPLLATLPIPQDPRVLVGSATADDAAVYRLTPELALVVTTDFFPPIVDDGYDFGRIAAANALSDIYAMGGSPIMALNLVGFPEASLPLSVLGDILRGGASIARAAGIDILGGHTISTEEPLYGLAAIGTVHPDQLVTNAGAQPGDDLVLTKPLGGGIIATAAKRDADSLGAIDEAIGLMVTLNAGAARAMRNVGVHAATDVTGFGLLGHLRNMLVASGVAAIVALEAVPCLDAARRYVSQGLAPGGTHANWRFLNQWVTYDDLVGKNEQLLLCDAQTSGGLLIAVPAERTSSLIAELVTHETPVSAIIGRVVEGDAGQMQVLPTFQD